MREIASELVGVASRLSNALPPYIQKRLWITFDSRSLTFVLVLKKEEYELISKLPIFSKFRGLANIKERKDMVEIAFRSSLDSAVVTKVLEEICALAKIIEQLKLLKAVIDFLLSEEPKGESYDTLSSESLETISTLLQEVLEKRVEKELEGGMKDGAS